MSDIILQNDLSTPERMRKNMRKDIIISERLHCGVSDEIFSQICKGN